MHNKGITCVFKSSFIAIFPHEIKIKAQGETFQKIASHAF